MFEGLNSIDEKIIKILKNDSRKSFVEIANDFSGVNSTKIVSPGVNCCAMIDLVTGFSMSSVIILRNGRAPSFGL